MSGRDVFSTDLSAQRWPPMVNPVVVEIVGAPLACAQGVQVHMATVARFMASLDVPARPEGSALPRPEVSHPASETAPASPAPGTSAATLGAEACQRKSPKPDAFR